MRISKTTKIRTQPVTRLQILFNQRIFLFRDQKIIDKEFLNGLFTRKRELDQQIKSSIRNISIYLVVIYLTGMGIEFELPLMGFKLKDIPGLLEITTILCSLSIVLFSMRFVDDQVHRRLIDSVISIHYSNNPLVNAVVKAAHYTEVHFFTLFAKKIHPMKDSIEPRLLTKCFNFAMKFTGTISLLLVASAPIILLERFAFSYTQYPAALR